MTGAAAPTEISLYVHVPFCRFKCFYCDFNTYAGIEGLIPGYIDAITTEVRRWGEALRQNGISVVVPTIFFGGGTPSLLEPRYVASVLEAMDDSFIVQGDAEISMEVNPESVSRDAIRGVRGVGVNRFSMGAQSMDNTELRMLGRLHDANRMITAYDELRHAGADNVNLDLMYGLPGQSLQTWEASLEGVLKLSPEHLSLYALTVEESTPFYGWVNEGRLPTPDDDVSADMYEMAEQSLTDAGYGQYEISNWSRPGRECRHNLVYWRNRPFIGFGPGAHSYLFGARFAVMRQPRSYIERMAELGRLPSSAPPALPSTHGPLGSGEALRAIAPIDSVDVYTDEMLKAETLVLGLRLNRGVVEGQYLDRFGARPSDLYREALESSIEDGLMERDGDVIRLTARGRLLSNEVFARIMA